MLGQAFYVTDTALAATPAARADGAYRAMCLCAHVDEAAAHTVRIVTEGDVALRKAAMQALPRLPICAYEIDYYDALHVVSGGK